MFDYITHELVFKVMTFTKTYVRIISIIVIRVLVSKWHDSNSDNTRINSEIVPLDINSFKFTGRIYWATWHRDANLEMLLEFLHFHIKA